MLIMETSNTSKKPLAGSTWLVAIISAGATDFILLAMGAACAFSSGITDGFCALPDEALLGIMAAVPIVLFGIIWQLRKRQLWRTGLAVAAAPFILLGLWIVFRILTQGVTAA
jgi:hypothetical protein